VAFASTITAYETSWLRGLIGLFIKPVRLQIAALCCRHTEKGPEILLVTSRGKGRYILPKGWPEADRPAYETALIEAYEEAGVVGTADKQALGSFRSFKGLSKGLKIRTKVLVFKILLENQLDEFPEKGQRDCVWMPLSEAIGKVDEPSLSQFLKRHRNRIF